MLIADVGQEVGCVVVVPEDLLGEVSHGGKSFLNDGGSTVKVADTARLLGVDLAEGGKGDNAQKSGDGESFHLNLVKNFIIIK